VPFVGIGAFFAHERSGHRLTSARARQFQIWLLTLDAFTDSPDDEAQKAVRAAAGASILTGPPIRGADSGGVAIDPQKLLDKVIDTVLPGEGK
jgi:hypothetical protein